ncbi:MAG: Fic family protein [Lachnospiraceae bacterium]
MRESDILRLHEMLLSVAGYEFGGKYKTDDNVILEVDTDGARKIHFRPTPAAETKKEMEQLELAYMDARDDANINQLLLIPCVILDFLCIHPFRDGNGRVSRLLSLLLLYKNGYDAGKYVSFEEQINNYKAYYYEALKQSSTGWDRNENTYFPFIENFLSTLYMCYKELDKRFAVVHGKKITKKARIEATVLNSLTPLSKAEICKILPDVSPTTVESVLGAMVKSGEIKRIGSSRSSRYIKV